MSSRSRVLIFLVSTPMAAVLIVGGLLGAGRPVPQLGVPHLRVFDEVVQLVTHAYVEDVNVDRVFDGAMRGLSDGLDASSAYLMPEEVRALESKEPQPAGEVGVVVSRQFYLRVVGVRDGSPASRAGIQEGDFIRTIDDKPTRDLSTFTGASLLRGSPGSNVVLLVIRNNAAEPHRVELTREVLTGEAVTSRRLPSGERYLRVASFGGQTAAAMRAQLPLGEMETLSGAASTGPAAQGVVIDLRGTADGRPEDGIAAARLFVKNGPLATRAQRNAENVVTAATTGDGALTMPVVLLVSNGTANAAEVFAAALVGNRRARLVGEPTAGLAGVQRLVRLPEGHGLWLTYAQYLQVDGTPIHQQGLRPSVIVEMPSVPFDEAPPATDPALERAVEELRKGEPTAAAPTGPIDQAAPDAAPRPRTTMPPTEAPQR